MAVQHYHGSCQCGAVDFDVDVDLDHAVTCNCSRCQRLGSVLAFAPRDKFTLNKGEDSLTEYLFNKHHIHHLFCRTCGIESFSHATGPDGTAMVAVNANCLDGVDPRSLNPQHYDGAAV
ncbi:GFA family protein [Martelella soudanensis]|uniref:GFA family protein n=1 Tax=unclassified Martelella TaxID=2629616 RepID=UPI0015DFAED1|nr:MULTISPECIES: GFA family protein [unclassified Martelella]